MKIGKYYFIEKEALKYYRLNNEKIYFEIKENGSIVKTSMTIERNEGNLEITKTVFSTSEALPNTKIEIYYTDTNELVFSYYNDENGKIVIEGLISFFLEEYKDGNIRRKQITMTSIRKFQNSSLDESNFVRLKS